MSQIKEEYLSNWPSVSIITVVRNGEKVIERTIKSIISQTYGNIEYIIIDGESSDRTLEVINKYRDKIAILVSEPDEGIADAFNKGINRAQGELIGLLNGGDWYEKDTVESVVKTYLTCGAPDIIHGDIYLHQNGSRCFLLSPCLNPERMRIEMIYNHPTCFVTRKTYEKFGCFDKSLKVAMDYDLLFRFYLNGIKFHYLPQVMANMMLGGVSDKQIIKSPREVLRIMTKYGYPRYKGILLFGYRLITESITFLLGRIVMLRLRENAIRMLSLFFPNLQGINRQRQYNKMAVLVKGDTR